MSASEAWYKCLSKTLHRRPKSPGTAKNCFMIQPSIQDHRNQAEPNELHLGIDTSILQIGSSRLQLLLPGTRSGEAGTVVGGAPGPAQHCIAGRCLRRRRRWRAGSRGWLSTRPGRRPPGAAWHLGAHCLQAAQAACPRTRCERCGPQDTRVPAARKTVHLASNTPVFRLPMPRPRSAEKVQACSTTVAGDYFNSPL